MLVHRTVRAHSAAASVVAFVLAFGLVSGSAAIAQQPTPNTSATSPIPTGSPDLLSEANRVAILAEETRAIRAVATDAEGFVDRMETWRSASDTIQSFSAGIADLRPYLDQVKELRLLGQMGLFDLLAQNGDDDLAQVAALIDGLAQGVEVLDTLDTLSAPTLKLGENVEQLLAKSQLDEDELQALRTSIPAGAEALRSAAAAYAELEPALAEAFAKLDEVEVQVRDAMTGMGPLLGTDAGKQIGALVDMVFDETRALKTDLDALADSVDADIATLARVERTLIEAEAHLAFARAEALALDDPGAAKAAFQAVSASFPGTSWAARADAWVSGGPEAEASASITAPADDTTTAMWIGGGFLLFGLVVCIGLVVWARRGAPNDEAAA